MGISQGQGQTIVNSLGSGGLYFPAPPHLRPAPQARQAVLEVLAVVCEQL